MLLILPRGDVIPRRRGLVLLAAYAAFVATTLPLRRNGEKNHDHSTPLAYADRRDRHVLVTPPGMMPKP